MGVAPITGISLGFLSSCWLGIVVMTCLAKPMWANVLKSDVIEDFVIVTSTTSRQSVMLYVTYIVQ